jgi:MFS family permease
MPKNFYLIIIVQSISGLGDHALLIIAIARLQEMQAADWLIPILKLSFVLSYVFLAPMLGHIADAWNKVHVMQLSNFTKVVSALMLFFGIDPVFVMLLAGFGAALYAPAKYGIITELLLPHQFVKANAYIEGSVVCAVIAGTVLGGFFVSPALTSLSGTEIVSELIGTSSKFYAGMIMLLSIYATASALNLWITHVGVDYPPHSFHPVEITLRFIKDNKVLWNDSIGRISMAITALLWGIGASLQLIVLRWAEESLGLGLDESAYLQGFAAFGLIAGALLASRYVSLQNSLRIIPVGILLGFTPIFLSTVGSIFLAIPILVMSGVLLGLFLIPMNALLQHRGHSLLTSGRSIAVQGFNENAGILITLGVYTLATTYKVSPIDLLVGLGVIVVFVLTIMSIATRGLSVEVAPRKNFDEGTMK